ncbi:MAG: pseudouridine synthase [Eubacteriales bacterium]
MRLDKFLSVTGTLGRSDSKRMIGAGRVFVNSVPAASADMQIDPERDSVCLDGTEIAYRKNIYIMLNKPEGVVSATTDGRDKTVLDLLPDKLSRRNLFPCGRLDKNTLGLMLITDDGELSHALLSPRRHVSKKYRYRALSPLSEADVRILSKGTVLEDGYITKPACVEPDPVHPTEGYITLTEGKYHQIKRMFAAVSNKITYLERVSFGNLTLDPSLGRGEWRYLLPEEETGLLKLAGKTTNS